MTLEIRSVVSKGDLSKERITLRAKSSLDVGDYALFQCGFADGTLRTNVINAFWFPYMPVNKGDLVVLYTKRGENSEKTLDSGATAHFVYWGLSSAIWNDKQTAAVLLNAPAWEAKPMAEL